jgi:hypothetical protein
MPTTTLRFPGCCEWSQTLNEAGSGVIDIDDNTASKASPVKDRLLLTNLHPIA